MTTKINNFKELYNVRLHKAESIVQKIEKYLPHTYVSTVISRVKKKHRIDVNSQHVRDVKRFKRKNLQILNVILDLAEENRKLQNKIETHAANNN
jgi:hypothetical protein